MEKEIPNVSFLPNCREFRYRGRVVVRLTFLQPMIAERKEINAFYAETYENLLIYAENVARVQEEKLLSRASRREFREISLRFVPMISYLDENYVSILWEYARTVRGTRPEVRKLAQTFSLERETLLPPTVFLGKEGKKISADAPYYLTKNGVVFL